MELGSNVEEVQHDCTSKKGAAKVVGSSNATQAEVGGSSNPTIVQNKVIVQGEQIACSSKPRKRKPRGPSKGVQIKIGELMILEFDVFLRHTGKWAKEYSKHCGACASRVDINLPSYFDVGEVEMYKNWDEAKRLFNIEEPYLLEKEAKFHAKVATHFRSWKTKLRRRWLVKKKAKPNVEVDMEDGVSNSEGEESSHGDEENEELENEVGDCAAKPKEKPRKPWEVYEGTISKEQWKTFARNYHCEEFQAISKKARASGSKNAHPHHMGQHSYSIAEVNWIKSGRLSPLPAPESSTVNATMDTSSIVYRRLRRAKIWLLGQQTQLKDGSWGIDPADTKTKEIAEKIEQEAEFDAKCREESNYVPEYGMDVLAKEMGKRDHSGRVKGIGGVNVGIENVFGKPKPRGRKVRTISESNHEKMSPQEMNAIFEKRLKEEVRVAVNKGLQELGLARPPTTDNTHHHTPTLEGNQSRQNLEVERHCLLVVMDMDNPYAGHFDYKLPCEHNDATTMGEA